MLARKKTVAGLKLSHISSDDKLTRVLSSALKSRLGSDLSCLGFDSYLYWHPEYFNLHKVAIFQDASEEEQAAILHIANYDLLEEAYFIEKAGVGYMAKMVLLAETLEERMLYALFSSDEVTHFAQISNFLPQQEILGKDNAFLSLLEEVAEIADKTVLLFVLQVVLEGWGLSHYRSLAKSCQNPELSAVFQGFLQDESRHHAAGVTLFEQIAVDDASRNAILHILTLFLRMVQAGPQGVVAAIEKVKGDLSRQQKIRIFEQLDTENHSGTRLNILRSLMQTEGGQIVQELEQRETFQPFSPEKCV
ncbi:MAG TPA: ferritin-like domain-containing protein [Oculatellaceae cyanobacterium]|jgi:tRNA isopentenyl-2-thiomethyl-A-37 hydroxylase MiaE